MLIELHCSKVQFDSMVCETIRNAKRNYKVHESKSCYVYVVNPQRHPPQAPTSPPSRVYFSMFILPLTLPSSSQWNILVFINRLFSNV